MHRDGLFFEQPRQRRHFFSRHANHCGRITVRAKRLQRQQRHQVAPRIGRVGLSHQVGFTHACGRIGFPVRMQRAGQLPVNGAQRMLHVLLFVMRFFLRG